MRKNPHRQFLPVGVLVLLAAFVPSIAFAQSTVETAAASTETLSRSRILSLADRYATFEWIGGEANVFHGDDPDGARVDTPDVSFDEKGWSPDGTTNHGMPYAWGGFTSIEEFEAGLKRGLYAGHVPATERALPSARAMGLDCSGFVARCWDLPLKQSTRSLGALCYELSSPTDLEPGDILNKFDSHVVLFKEWEDEERTMMRVVEAARLRVEESVYPVAGHVGRGFVPMRYKPLDARWVPMTREDPAFAAGEKEKQGRWLPGEGAEIDVTSLANPLRLATPRTWVQYAVTDDSPRTPPRITRTMMVARAGGGRVQMQIASEMFDKPLLTGRDLPFEASFVEALLDFLGPEEPLQKMTPVVSSVEQGTYVLNDRRFPARHISAFLEGSTVMRHKSYPVTIEVECVQSDEVPLHGILEGSFVAEVVWETDEDGEPSVISRRTLGFSLLAFGGPADLDR